MRPENHGCNPKTLSGIDGANTKAINQDEEGIAFSEIRDPFNRSLDEKLRDAEGMFITDD